MIRNFLAAALLLLPACAFANCTGTAPVNEARFIAIGGIEQWVTIKGASCANPVVLFIHGGPGNPLSPYADAVYGAWEKDFTLVQWDQRGAGKSFTRNPATAEAELSLELMTRDGVELAAYLSRYLGKEKLILLGGSWGSVLGVHMAKARPALFSAYVGAGQLVSQRDNEASSRARLLALAHAANDAKTVAAIEALGPLPWTNPRAFGILRRATRGYEAQRTTPAPKHWWIPAPAYATPQMEAEYEAGEDYSYLQFVGMQGKGMYSRVDLGQLGSKFEMPVYLVQGEQDLVTTPEIAKAWFDTLEAPKKEFILLPLTGHDPNQAMVDAEFAILKGL